MLVFSSVWIQCQSRHVVAGRSFRLSSGRSGFESPSLPQSLPGDLRLVTAAHTAWLWPGHNEDGNRTSVGRSSVEEKRDENARLRETEAVFGKGLESEPLGQPEPQRRKTACSAPSENLPFMTARWHAQCQSQLVIQINCQSPALLIQRQRARVPSAQRSHTFIKLENAGKQPPPRI